MEKELHSTFNLRSPYPSVKMPVLALLRAKFDFLGKEEEELSFQAGETIYLLYKDESGWAKGMERILINRRFDQFE